MFDVTATVKPGVDPALVEKRLDEIIADFIANGPTEDEVQRAATSEVAGRIRGLEQVGGFGGKAVALAEGQVYAGDCDFYKQTLAAYAAVDPGRSAGGDAPWLTRPALTVRLEPGERPPYVEAKGSPARQGRADIRDRRSRRKRASPAGRRSWPPLDFPDVSHTHAVERHARRLMRSARRCR